MSSFPKYELVNCHPKPDIFYVQPEGHECQPHTCLDGSVVKCDSGADSIAHVSNREGLKPQFEAMQEILRRSNLHDELVAALEHVHAMIERHWERGDGDPAELIYPELESIEEVLAKAKGSS